MAQAVTESCGTSATSTRRTFLKKTGLATCGIATGVLGYTWRIEPHWIEIVRRNLPIAHLPQGLIGKTLVHVSDLHVGPIVDDRYLAHAIRQIAPLEPDIVAITGDFMTYREAKHVEQTARVLEQLPLGKLATVGVLGNHDYGRSCSHPSDEVADGLVRQLGEVGITVLRNSSMNVGGLQIVGVDDLWGPHFDPTAALSQLTPSSAKVVLCHNPDAADLPVWSDYQGWMLCGHTHGGQCKSPFLRPPVLPVKNKRYTAGEIDLYDGRKLYINPGLGYLRRVRFNVRPEITVFTLTPATIA